MAEKRKLLAEIEKCYKKIDEGVELFEEIMNKMQEANSDNQRDKYQDDLKKEIKKLQRLRDQVKNWQNSSEIKDKEKLISYRKLIEQRMEQFKDVERENKTKPHSKLGLSAEEKLDPKEKEKADTVDWIQNQIRALNDESDRTEMQLESLSNTDSGKKRGKKEDARAKNEREKRIETLRHHLERLKFHIEKLEVCMRMISNESLNAKTVFDVLKEPIEAYVELMDTDGDDKNNYDPEDAYDELDLEKLCAQIGGVNLLSVDDEHKENGHELGIDTEFGAVSSSRHGSNENGQPPSPACRRVTAPISMSSPISQSSPHHSTDSRKLIKESSFDRPRSPATAILAPPPPPPGIPYNSVAAGRSTTTPVPNTPQGSSTHSSVTPSTIKAPLSANSTVSSTPSIDTTNDESSEEKKEVVENGAASSDELSVEKSSPTSNCSSVSSPPETGATAEAQSENVEVNVMNRRVVE
ncbi:unnamed protein product [Caenorhabditis bovis]|uniref:CCR4-Not complex component Not N-terminal domain-containing protein n=1 Tax=Caenorhabditis bovis TaxID=2654633 RepID=A0A8S1ET16_9PELO|nr:unnamed protein product [Caenorhabditis bovis]